MTDPYAGVDSARLDLEANALYIPIRAGVVAGTRVLGRRTLVDFDASGSVLGIEILDVHREPDHLWVEVAGLPGCFASGKDMDELRAAALEAIELYLAVAP